MSENYDLAVIAGEYVLGTLDPTERAFVEKERKQNSSLEAEIDFWDAILLPITDGIASIEPSLQLWNRLDPLLIVPRKAAPQKAEPVYVTLAPAAPLSRPVRIVSDESVRQVANAAAIQPASDRGIAVILWKTVALVASLVAIAATYYGITLAHITHSSINPIALIEQDLNAPAFKVSVNQPEHAITVVMDRRTAAPKNKSYELWLIIDNQPQPRSLGLVTSSETTLHSDLIGADDAALLHATFAISVEPPGGSVTGLPTGQIVATGRLIPG